MIDKKIRLQYFLAIMISVIYLITLMIVIMEGLLYGYYEFYPHSIQQIEIFYYVHQYSHSGLLDVDYLTVAERRHLFDVKDLMISLKDYVYYSLFSSGLLFFFSQKVLHRLNIFKLSSYIGLGSIGVLLTFIFLSDFMTAFHYFHAIFFYEDTWIFPKGSKLTQLFPIEYFYHFSLLYLGVFMLFLSSIALWNHPK